MNISPQDVQILNKRKIRLINDLWAAERTVLHEISYALARRNIQCLHEDLDALMGELNVMLGTHLEVDPDEQSVPYPLNENGNK